MAIAVCILNGRYKNSGTYNNQYMVVDLKRFEPKQRLAPGLLWVVEQVGPCCHHRWHVRTLSKA